MHSTKSSDTESSTATSAADIQRKSSDQQEEKLQKKGDPSQSSSVSGHTSKTGLSAIISGDSGNAVHLQNAALSSMISSGIQPKLEVGSPDDKYEQEADKTADKVMRMADPSGEKEEQLQAKSRNISVSRMIQRKNGSQKDEELVQRRPDEQEDPIQRAPQEKKEESVQRKSDSEENEDLVQKQPEEEPPAVQAKSEEEEESVMRKADNSGGNTVSSGMESTLKSSKGSGDPLPSSVKGYMEPRFGSDFSNVRLHTGSDATRMNKSLNARAFTHGSDIYFNEGNYNPDTSNGKRLIAHELTHTIQQGAVQKKGKVRTSSGTSGRHVQRSWYGDAWNAVSDAASGAAEWVGDSLDAGKEWLMGWLQEQVVDVPGYELFTVVLGEDPITEENVPRNGRNFIEAGLDIIPNGETFKNKLQEQGTLGKAAKWLDGQINTLDISPAKIGKKFQKFWDGISLSDVRNPGDVLDRLLKIFSGPINRIISFTENVASKFLEIVKDYLLSKIKEFIKNKQSPSFYPLLTVTLGNDPITGEEVEQTGKNILTGFMKLHPDGDKQLKKMRETNTFGRAARWINRSIVRIKNIATGLGQAFKSIWESVTDINTLKDPTGTFEEIYKKFSTPLIELSDFMWTVGKKVLSFVKDALLSRLSAFARNTRGYPLITVILGKDPFTGKKVPRTASRIIKGFFSLMENGVQKFKKLKKSGAIARTTAWMSKAIARLGITWEYIVGLFKTAWNSLTINDLMEPLKAFRDIVNLFTPPIKRLINFVTVVVKKVIEILLKIMNFPANLISSIIQKTAAVIGLIKKDPVGFIKNLMRGVKKGFQQFFNNIGTHLLNGLTDWLFSKLEQAGIQRPPDLSLKSILGIVMQILGITKEKIFDKIAEKIGREKMQRIRGFMEKLKGIWGFVKDVIKRGPVAIWEYVKEKISNLWNMVFEQVKSWIMEKIITKVTTKLLSMLDPSGVMAVVNSFIAIYNAIESFTAYFTKMLKMVNRFVDGVAAVASGNLAPAANKLESSLSKGVPIAIGFLANQVGLSGLGKKISKMIGAVRAKVDSAIDWLIDKAMKAGKAIINMGKSAVGAVKSWWKRRKKVRTKDRKTHEIYFDGTGRSSKLMIASDPQPYVEYLNEIKASHDLKEKDISSAKSKAKEVEQAKNKKVDNEKQQNKGAKINNLIDELATKTAEIPLSSSGKTNTPPVFGPLRQGFGTLARVAYLRAPHKDDGSSPNVNNTDLFKSINLRRKGQGAYYVKGHLLNDNLRGPGDSWTNLTPITQKANSNHKTKFENPVKGAVNDSISRNANPPEKPVGHVKDFIVKAEYGRSLPESYNILVADNDEQPAGMSEDVDPQKMARLLRAEQYVPTQLVCKATVKEYKGNGKGKKEELNVTIDNNIQYGQLSSYSLNATAKDDFVFAEQIDFDADKISDAVKELQQLNGIGPVRARTIYNELEKSGTIYDYSKQIGISKQALAEQNPGYKITSGDI